MRGERKQLNDVSELVHATGVAGWDARLPWLWAATTRRDWGGDPVACSERFLAAGWRSVVRSRQVHGAVVRVHVDPRAGVWMAGDGDGHVTRTPGLLLAVTLADCVPVFVADPVQRAVGLLHAGWRGAAAGMLERGLAALGRGFGSLPSDLFVHLGPAICGQCYEVGPEVFAALGETVPSGPAAVDLRAVLRRRALAAGVDRGRLIVSEECTLCGDGRGDWRDGGRGGGRVGGRYFSHRGGDAGRHLGAIGILPRSGASGCG